MGIIIMVCQLLLGLCILVFLHELGHFLAAKIFGMRVEKFYIFFDVYGKKLLSFKRGDTEYGIGVLPLGGYVKIAGMMDESLDKEQINQPPQPWEFRSKPAWQRIIVMVAGVFLNVVLGCAIFAMLLWKSDKGFLPIDNLHDGIYVYGLAKEIGLQTGDKIIKINDKKVTRYEDISVNNVMMGAKLLINRKGENIEIITPNIISRLNKTDAKLSFIGVENYPAVITDVLPGSNAEKGNLKVGDKITKVDTIDVKVWGNFREIISSKKNKNADITIERNGLTNTLNVRVDSSGIIGVASQPPYKYEKYSFLSSIKYGYMMAIEILEINVKGFLMIFKGEVKANESIQGPIGIAKIYGKMWDWNRFWTITGMLSMALALINILPIPALDGGHVLLLLVEGIIRRPLPTKVAYVIQIIGVIIVISLMIFSIGNDIYNQIK